MGLTVLLSAMTVGSASADVNVGLSVNSDGQKSFYLAIGSHYNVPEKEVIIVREKKIPDEELPVVFFLARKTSVAPELLISLRLNGMSWMAIAKQYNVGADVFYVPVVVEPGPPYGKAYGLYKNKKKSEWKKIELTDSEIVNFVNLRFISDHYGCSPDQVIEMREKGKTFVLINGEVKANKGQSKKQSASIDSDKGKNNKGNDKKKDK